MTDTKLEPELPQATFFITGEIGKPMIPAYTAEQVRAAIEADRNNRAPVSLTDEQIIEEARRADLFNEYRTLIRLARALLSSVAPRVPEGFVLVPKEPTQEMCAELARQAGIGMDAAHWLLSCALSAAPQHDKE